MSKKDRYHVAWVAISSVVGFGQMVYIVPANTKITPDQLKDMTRLIKEIPGNKDTDVVILGWQKYD